MLRKIPMLAMSIVVIMLVAFVFYQALNFFVSPLMKPGHPVYNIGLAGDTRVVSGTIVRQENSYLCKDVETVYQGPAPRELVGLTEKELEKKYPAEEGWSIKTVDGGILVLTRNVDDFCSLHRDYRHLGIYRNVLAVYQGPLGCDQKLIRLEEGKRMELLPEDLRKRLESAADLANVDPAAREELKYHLEFENEAMLNSMLENLDEVVE
ncbi:hypothetical protein DCCM_4455 [Desulfocucumis palustris]|uniref:Bypass of forespore C C-terminal domain-containing protein n=1 Tax=Desulfocucumis palustris TaxID=1898651 RepID=A0A2L2XGS1_9FIRM|nr:hypothetical protein [Desulfocucumis palustris]GBF35332.1 hypothetical protein DCCM_4455 [Desulfocucumis palustris]